jgi:hypothetical protein
VKEQPRGYSFCSLAIHAAMPNGKTTGITTTIAEKCIQRLQDRSRP